MNFAKCFRLQTKFFSEYEVYSISSHTTDKVWVAEIHFRTSGIFNSSKMAPLLTRNRRVFTQARNQYSLCVMDGDLPPW